MSHHHRCYRGWASESNTLHSSVLEPSDLAEEDHEVPKEKEEDDTSCKRRRTKDRTGSNDKEDHEITLPLVPTKVIKVLYDQVKVRMVISPSNRVLEKRQNT